MNSISDQDGAGSRGVMLKVGLTGGIATGKSHVLGYLVELGAEAVDADVIAREVVLPGRPAFREIVETFGPEVLADDGTIDRKVLGRVVFADAERRRRLNAIVHPRILAEEDRRLRQLEAESGGGTLRMVVIDAALMIEAGSYRKYDVLVVVYCPPRIQLERVMLRDGLSEMQARQRIASQMPIIHKLAFADYVIETSEEQFRTRAQVQFLYRELMFRLESGELPDRRRA